MKMKRTILILLGLTFGLFAVGTAKAEPRVQYIIISDHADRGYSSHWRGKRLDTERYRAFSRDYYEPRLYSPRRSARCGSYDYNRSYRRHYDRDRTYIVVPDKRRYYRDRHSRHYDGDRHYRRNKHNRHYQNRHHYNRHHQSGGRLVIDF